MNNTSKIRLSLRKLFIAMMAVGPMAVLPSPVWAVVPTASSFTIANGSASVSTTGATTTIQTSDRAVLVWGNNTLQSAVGGVPAAATDTVTNFYVGVGEVYNFALPPSGSILNRVKAGNATAAGQAGTGMGAVINGTLLSDGKVYILADSGHISVGTGASISTAGGLVLTTLTEPSDGGFTNQGDLLNKGDSTGDLTTLGNITISNGATITGNLFAYSNTTNVQGATITGDAVLRNVKAAGAMSLGGAAALMKIGGNLSVTTNKGAVTQAGPVEVGFGKAENQVTTIRTGDAVAGFGDVAITLNNASNNFEDVVFTTGNGAVSITDVSTVRLGASTTNGSLTVVAGNGADSMGINIRGGNSITTNGELSILGGATFRSMSHGSHIVIGNNASVGGTLVMQTASGNMTFNGTGNKTTGLLTVGNVDSSIVAASGVTLSGVNMNTNADGSSLGTVKDYPVAGPYTAATANADTVGAPVVTVVFNGVATTAATAQPRFSKNTSASATIPVNGSLSSNVSATAANHTAGVAATFGAGTGYGTVVPTVTYAGGTLQSNAGAINIQSTGNVSVTGTVKAGDATLATTFANPGITVRGTAVDANAGTISSTGAVTINATAGNVTLGTTMGSTLNAIATGGSITQAATKIITTAAPNTTVPAAVITPGTSTLNATNAVTLNEANSLQAGSTLNLLAGTSSSVNTINNVVLGNVTAKGDLGVTSLGTIQVGTGTGALASKIDVVGNATLTADGVGGITDNAYSALTVGGALNLNTGKYVAGVWTPSNQNAVLTAAYGNGALAPRVSVGQVNAMLGTGALTMGETTTINLGNITASAVTVNSTTGGVVDGGNLTISGLLTTKVAHGQSAVFDGLNHNVGGVSFSGAGSSASYVSNAAATTVTATTDLLANLTLSTVSAGQTINVGTVVAQNLTVNSAGLVDITGTADIRGNATITAAQPANVNAIAQSTGTLLVSGVTTLTATGTGGGINLPSGANQLASVVLAGNTGAVVLNDANDLTVSGTSLGTVTVKAGQGTTANTWSLVLGNLTVDTLAAFAGNGGGANSGSITQQTGTKISTFNAAGFTTVNGTITINNTGNNFGPVSATTGGANTDSAGAGITIRESGSMRVGTIMNNGVNSTLTSETGSILERVDATNTVYRTTNATLTLNAPNGSIELGNKRTSGTTSAAVDRFVVNAPNGRVSLVGGSVDGGRNLVLGNITANSLEVNYTGNRSLSQDGSLKVYGSANFTIAGGSRGISLNNTTNNFGRLGFVSGNGSASISVTEAGTLNLGTVSMPGGSEANFTATSVNGSIIDTGLASVKPGGVNGLASPTVLTQGTGIVKLSAKNGDIILDDPTTDFPTTGGVQFEAKGLVKLSPLGGSTLVLGAANTTSTAGNLTVTSATGAVSQANTSSLSVAGDFFVQTGNQPITITQANNNFGTVQFVGSAVKISEASDLAIVTGSAATGATELVSGGNITFVSRGGIVNFGSTATAQTLLVASGGITIPKVVQVAGTLTLAAAGTKDLSALSLSSDLGGKTPVNLGSGSYVPPQP